MSSAILEKTSTSERHVEEVPANDGVLTYEDVEKDPELHARTYLALIAMFVTIWVQVICLQGPPLVLTQIGASLRAPQTATWVVNSLSLVQAVLSPIISSASDVFRARKAILVGTALISMVGAAIAPGSQDIYRLIVAQTLIGFCFSAGAIVYSVTSEIVPHRWRPLSQAFLNTGAALGACSGPLIMGVLCVNDPENGWRKFYVRLWIQTGLWAFVAITIFLAYKPLKRESKFDDKTFWEKVTYLDLLGMGLLTIGLSLLLTGLSLGGGLYSWSSIRPLILMVLGALSLVGFGFYEWKCTSTGILHHDLFRKGKNAGRTFSLCVLIIFVEGIVLFAYALFFPIMTRALFETDTLLLAVREQAWWIAAGGSTIFWGWLSSKYRTIRGPLIAGFVLFTAGMIGFTTIQPGQSANSIAFSAVSGFGFGAPLILVIVGVQLSVPHSLIATASAIILSTRAVAVTIFTAIYLAVFSDRLAIELPESLANVAVQAGLPREQVSIFIGAISSNNETLLAQIPGLSEATIEMGINAMQYAFADSIRPVFIIAVAFGALGVVCCYFLGDLREAMDYRVDAPVEALHAKKQDSVPASV